ncbi:MAG: hypothetical protein AAF849_23725 [Bacteroidota bacterium]
MVAPNDILGRRNEIKDCLAAADMAKAVKRLMDFADDFHPESKNMAIGLSFEFNDLKKVMLMGSISFLEQRQIKNSIVSRILITVDDIVDQKKLAA